MPRNEADPTAVMLLAGIAWLQDDHLLNVSKAVCSSNYCCWEPGLPSLIYKQSHIVTWKQIHN